jgi:hypothetical protein
MDTSNGAGIAADRSVPAAIIDRLKPRHRSARIVVIVRHYVGEPLVALPKPIRLVLDRL